MKVRKAIIPAAGLGTRFLPATKAMPKEMLPIVDKPMIQYIVEEAIAAGIEDILIVTGRNKRAIEDHFDNATDLEMNLMEKGKLALLEKVQESANVDLHYIRQKNPRGLGHAVWCARNFIGNEPFAVLLGDDIVQSEVPCIQQLMREYEGTSSSVVAVQQVPMEETHRYGIVDPIEQVGKRYQVRQFVEKPKQGEAPSRLAIIGRYVLRPEIFQFLEEQNVGTGGEIQLTDAIGKLNEIQRVFAYEYEGKRFDVGEKLGFIQTTIEFALQDTGLQEGLLPFLSKMVEENG